MDKLKKLADWNSVLKANYIESELYQKYNVQRGLRDVNGNGVLTGLTRISEVTAFTHDAEGNKIPCDGILKYRGINIRDLIQGVINDNRFGFEETTYLLLFGSLPDKKQLASFNNLLNRKRQISTDFVTDIIIRTPCKDMMNTMSRGVLALYSYDDNPDSIEPDNVLRQCLDLIAKFPVIAVYAYQSYTHHFEGSSLVIHTPLEGLSTAENLLRLLRVDSRYTPLEAHVLDVALMLHAEHGGGNNSTFTNRVVSSSGSDTYSAISAALGSLKGPRHGGANVKVVRMFDDLKATVKDTTSEKQVEKYLVSLLEKKGYDRSGLIYGMGHAVYSLSDPRAEVLKHYAKRLSDEKGLQEDYALYETVGRLATKLIGEKRRIYKGVSPNVDFYSGLIYKMLDIPYELYTPLFAISRIVGWSAHRIEELVNDSKIIRPAYMNVGEDQPYIGISDR